MKVLVQGFADLTPASKIVTVLIISVTILFICLFGVDKY